MKESDPTATPPNPQRQRGHGWIWLLVVVALAVAGWHYRQALFSAQAAGASTSGPGGGRGGRGGGGGPVPVVVATAASGSLPVYLDTPGTVAPYYSVSVHAQVNGQVVKVDFKEGQVVHEGDVLVEIDPHPYQAALDQATSNLAQAQANLAKDRAAVVNAQAELERYTQLNSDGVVSREQFDQMRANAGSADATVTADQAAIMAAKAAQETAQINLNWTKITAPVTGRISFRMVDPGNIVHTTDTVALATITQVQPIAVLFSLPQIDLQQVDSLLRAGQHPGVTTFGLDNKQLAAGTVEAINNQIDTTTGTFQAKATFPNTDNALFPSQFVSVRLLVGEDTDLTVVPNAAIQLGPQGSYVFVITPQHTASVRSVTVKLTQGNQAGISQGLQPGENIVIDGADKLEDGTHVNPTSQGGQPASGAVRGTGRRGGAAAAPGGSGSGN